MIGKTNNSQLVATTHQQPISNDQKVEAKDKQVEVTTSKTAKAGEEVKHTSYRIFRIVKGSFG